MKKLYKSFMLLLLVLGCRLVPDIASASTQPLSVVQQACLGPQTDMVLGLWNFDSGYLYCKVQDNNTGRDLVMKQGSGGSFSVVIRAGGHVDVATMVSFGISTSVAKALYSGLHP